MSGSGGDDGWQTESDGRGMVSWDLDDGVGTPSTGTPRLGSSGWVMGAVAAGLVGIIGLVGWLLATSPVDDAPAEPVAADEPATTATVEPTPDLQEPAELDIDDAVEFVETRASTSFRQMLTETAASLGIAYRTGDQLTLLDFGRGEIAPMEESFTSRGVPAVELLRTSDGRTYAVDASTRQATLVAGGGYVVETLWPGLVTRTSSAEPIIGPGEIATVGPLDGSAPQVDIPLQEGARRLPLPGVGLVMVSDGGSDLVGAGAMRHLSDNEIVSATPRAWLERACTPDGCRLELVDFESREVLGTLPDAFDEAGSSHLISPDSAYVLRIGVEGNSDLYSLADGGISFVIGDGMQAPRWAADSSFIVWLDTMVDEPRLKIMFLAPPAWIAVGFEDIGAGLPDGAELVIVS